LVAASIRGGALVSVTEDHDAILEESSDGSAANDSYFPPTIVQTTEESSSSPAILLPAGLDMTELAGSSTTAAAAYRHGEVQEQLRVFSQRLTQLGDRGLAVLVPLLCALFGVRHSSSSSLSSSSGGLMNFWSIYIWSLIGSSVGFYVFLYFISVGYALGIGLPILITTMAHIRYYYRTTMTTRTTIGLGAILDDYMTMTLVHAGLVLLWSARLVVFLLWREYANWPALHAKIVQVNRHQRQTFRTWQKLACWTVYSFLYVCLVSPCWTRLEQAAAPPLGMSSTTMRLWISRIGIVLQAVGLSLETVADWQKSAYKKQPGKRQSWCRVGVWQHWPHPNYLGEWLFWCGTYLAGGSPRSHFERAMQIIGLVFISIVLHGAATTLRARQSIKYGAPYDAFRASHTIFGPKLQWPKWRSNTRGDNAAGSTNNDAIDSVDPTAMPSLLNGSDVTNPELLAQS
jgi:steroid 5-alpha reductase family enzyme